MSTFRFFILLLLVSLGYSQVQCNNSELTHIRTCECDSSVNRDASGPATESPYNLIQGALLGSRFKSLEELKSVIQIEYVTDPYGSDSTSRENTIVRVFHCSNGHDVISVLKAGISQGDMSNARNGNFWDRLHLLLRSPFAITNRMDLSKVYLLARRRADLFGEGDPAFYDLAETAVKNINTQDLAFINVRDSTEKGYLNSFNHITAQAFITSCFSERLADFVGDAHERYYHPELITGRFSEEEVRDLDEGPVDNYVDLINNEWGQELGKVLKEKYNISKATYWTPELLASYLNDLQSYYSWAFQIGFKPVRSQDEVVIRFSNKLNLVLLGAVSVEMK